MATKETPKSESKPDRIDLRIYNTIVVFDVYTVARSPEAAREALIAAIAAGEAKPTEIAAKEVTMVNSIRQSWTETSPYVAADVTDEEFETLRGITTLAAWDRFYKRPGR
jgi:hypothetical protein